MNRDMYEHEDVLGELNNNIPLRDKLHYVHELLIKKFSFIDRIAATIYDPKTDVLKTFAYSSNEQSPLVHYQAKLSSSNALQEILKKGRPRIVNNLEIYAEGEGEHTKRIKSSGYQSSYTMPMYLNGTFFGFIFFNSYLKNPFNREVLHYLDIYGHLISLLIINEVSSIHTLLAALKTAREVTHHRDVETGTHLDRMSRYARLIARHLADKYHFNDEYIENVFLFAPLHDIGKIGIPDRVLLKPGKLDEQEYLIMQGHVEKGRQIIDEMLENFGLDSFHHTDILRNIARYHHEAMDGTGYPGGLQGEEIPIEARIIAVADVFDALTSRRPYKAPWSNDESFEALRLLAGKKLDHECVEALIENRTEVEEIQARFKEDHLG